MKKRNSVLIMLCVLSLGMIAIGIWLLSVYPSQKLFMILVGIGIYSFLVIIGIMFANLLKRKKPDYHINKQFDTMTITPEERKNSNELYEQRVNQALQVAQGKQESIPITKDLSVIEYTGTLTVDVCMVCKLFLEKNDKILQCPICESLYHRDHLLEWIKIKKRCPVCSQVLIKNKGRNSKQVTISNFIF